MSAEETRSIARRIIEELDRRNLQGVVDLAAPGAKWHGFMSLEPLDTDAYKATMSALLAAFPDSHFSLDDVIVEENKAAIRHTFRGTQREEFAGIPASGRSVTVPATFSFRTENGRMTEGWL